MRQLTLVATLTGFISVALMARYEMLPSAVWPLLGTSGRTHPADVPLSTLPPEQLYEVTVPSVVTIYVKDDNETPIASGSGFVVADCMLGSEHLPYEHAMDDKEFVRGWADLGVEVQQCYVLTNSHVIRPAVSADVLFTNGDKGIVTWVLAEDVLNDIALLSVNVFSPSPRRPIPLATSDPKVLSTVYAIGSPKGFQATASEGKVSGYRNFDEGEYCLQTTAPISHGSSGGPLLTQQGSLAGITTSMWEGGQNLNFAIPVSVVRTFLSTTNFNERRRAVADGASITWHEDTAFRRMKEATRGNRFSGKELQAIQHLELAREENQAAWDDTDPIARHRKAYGLAQAAISRLPQEFRYLGHYVAGQVQGDLQWSKAMQSWDNPGTLKEALGSYKDGLDDSAVMRHFMLAASLSPDFSPAWMGLARIHLQRKSWQDGLAASGPLVTLMPRSAEALTLRAACWKGLGEPQLAAMDQKAAAQLSPSDGMLHRDLGDTLVETGDYTGAVTAYKHALAIGVEPIVDPWVRLQIGVAYRKAGLFEQAIAYLEDTQSTLPTSVAPLFEQEIAKCRQQQR